ncbi:MAG: SCO family protein [Ignavibacteria bacterium]|nr:SCO family protein [Ignavibacteria bacterium]
MKKRTISILFAAILASCSSPEKEQTVEQVTFPLSGRVVEVDTARLRVVIKHDEIPDYMPEMTMPFKVKDPELLDSVEPGDSVIGLFVVSRVESWLADLQVLGAGEAAGPLSASGLNVTQVFLPGDELPDVMLLNQEGERVRLIDFRGNVVAMTFIYSRCPIPDFCIRMSDHFARIQRSLKQRRNEGAWRLLTVSFDPVFDRPGVLKDYGENYGADFRRWSFLTDPDTSGATIERLAGGFGLLFEDDEGALIAHNLRTAIIGTDGRLVEVVRDNEWTPEEIVEKMEDLMD